MITNLNQKTFLANTWSINVGLYTILRICRDFSKGDLQGHYDRADTINAVSSGLGLQIINGR